MSECQNLIKNANAIGEEFPLDKVMSNRMVENSAWGSYDFEDNGDPTFGVANVFVSENRYPPYMRFISKRIFHRLLSRCAIWGSATIRFRLSGIERYSFGHPAIQIQILPSDKEANQPSIFIALIDHDKQTNKYRLLVPIMRTSSPKPTNLHDFRDIVLQVEYFVEPWFLFGQDDRPVTEASWVDYAYGFMTIDRFLENLRGLNSSTISLGEGSFGKADFLEAIGKSLDDVKQIYPELFQSEE